MRVEASTSVLQKWGFKGKPAAGFCQGLTLKAALPKVKIDGEGVRSILTASRLLHSLPRMLRKLHA